MLPSLGGQGLNIDLEVKGQSVDAILAEARESGITLFGAGTFARTVASALQAENIRVAAMVVTSPVCDNCDGIRLVSLASLDESLKRLPMWIAVFNREPTSDIGKLSAAAVKAGMRSVLTPPQYYEIVAHSMGWRYWLSHRDKYIHHRRAIEDSIDSLADDRSRQQLAAAISFRLGGNPADVPQPDFEAQYFPSFMTLAGPSNGVFVDGGAYDGDTIRAAASYLGLTGAVAFEPDPENFRRLADSARLLPFPVTCYPCGLSSDNGHLRYSLGQGEASAVSEDGEDSVPVSRLDDCLPNISVAYLKLDVEGHELKALAGAEQCLHRCHPKLAIAGYHRWDDLWLIPQFIRQLDRRYRIAFRIHAHNTFDSVFYAY